MLHPGALALRLVLEGNGLLFSGRTGTQRTHESWAVLAGKGPQCGHHSELLRIAWRGYFRRPPNSHLFGLLPPRQCIHCRDRFLFSLAFSVALSPQPHLYPAAWEWLCGHFINIILLPRRKLWGSGEVWGLVPGHEAKVALFHGSVIWGSCLSAPGRLSLPR